MTLTKKWKKLARAADNQEHENSSGDIPDGRPDMDSADVQGWRFVNPMIKKFYGSDWFPAPQNTMSFLSWNCLGFANP